MWMICQVQDACRLNSIMMNMTTRVDDVYSQSGGRGHKLLCSLYQYSILVS
jgi:hypothetical protein